MRCGRKHRMCQLRNATSSMGVNSKGEKENNEEVLSTSLHLVSIIIVSYVWLFEGSFCTIPGFAPSHIRVLQ